MTSRHHCGVQRRLRPAGCASLALGVVLLLTPLFAAVPTQAPVERLGPGVISTDDEERPCGFTDEGRTVLFVRFSPTMRRPTLCAARLVDGEWRPAPAPAFAATWDVVDPSLSPAGTQLFFASRHPIPGATGAPHLALWVSRKNGDTWSEPEPLDGAVAGVDGEELSPSVASDGTLYFISSRWGGAGNWDIYRSKPADGHYGKPELVPPRGPSAIFAGGAGSSTFDECGVSASPDGRLLVFASADRPGGRGACDLYEARFVEGTGVGTGWICRSLPTTVNTPDDERSPRISPDGHTLLFGRNGDLFTVDLARLGDPAVTRSDRWETRAPMPAPILWPQWAVRAGRIYVCAVPPPPRPNAPAPPPPTVYEYDPASDRWNTLAPAPAGWVQVALGSVADRLLMFRRGSRGAAEYDFDRGAWTPLPASGEPDADAIRAPSGPIYAGRVASDNVSIFGSRTLSVGVFDETGVITQYDVEQRRWVALPAPPVVFPQLAVLAGRVCVVSGGTRWTQFQMYEPAKRRWQQLAPIPTGRYEMALGMFAGELWAVGGHDRYADMRTAEIVESYDPATNRWTERPSLPQPRWGAGAAAIDDVFYVFGGAEGVRPHASMICLRRSRID